ncbi:hypothetical protein ABIQ69_13475 [Agromyces sp. G08B096]|uniref:MFS transporter n=1 Tax=Agromyces sp. G08B096 TaxID=3156399 RepID=A0AAU7W577_9MICO
MSAVAPDPTPAPSSTHGAPAPAGAAGTEPARRSPLGLVSLVAGAAVVLVGAITAFVLPFVVVTTDYALISLVQSISSALVTILALVAVITGAIVLFGRDRRKAFAASGTALGAAALVNVVMGLVQSGIYSVL